MEVARYVGDAAPNGKLFWHFNPVPKPEALTEAATFRSVAQPGESSG